MADIATAIVAVISIVVVVLIARHRILRAQEQTAQAEKALDKQLEALAIAQRQMDGKALLQIADWGPDFTGEDDVLPRYRWVISTLDLLKPMAPALMVGNEPTYPAAVHAAYMWLEDNQVPVQVVTSAGIDEEVSRAEPTHP